MSWLKEVLCTFLDFFFKLKSLNFYLLHSLQNQPMGEQNNVHDDDKGLRYFRISFTYDEGARKNQSNCLWTYN